MLKDVKKNINILKKKMEYIIKTQLELLEMKNTMSEMKSILSNSMH